MSLSEHLLANLTAQESYLVVESPSKFFPPPSSPLPTLDFQAPPTRKLVVSQLRMGGRELRLTHVATGGSANESYRMSPYCTKTPTSIDSTDPILLSSTSNTPPSPPPSPLRAGWNSGLNTRPSSKVLSKRRCSGLAEDRGNEPHLNHISGHNMTSVPQLGVKNGKAFSGTSRQRVGHSNSHEQVSNVGSNAADSNAAILASNGYRSPSEILQKLHTQTFNAPTPKKKRYFEVDPSTGEERITERMDGPVSTKGGSEKRVYPVPGYAPLGHSHSNNNLHPIGGSASPLKTQISLGFDDGDVDPRAILSFPANFSTPESACYRKEHICESPTLMSRAVSAAEEEKPNGAGSHGAKTFARALSPEVALTETAFTARSVSSTLVGSQLGMSCAAETSTTPLATTLSAPPSVRGTVGSTSERSGCAAMLPTLRAGMPSQPGQINGLGLVEPITAQLLLERPLNEVSKDALLEKGKRRREPPTPLSLADNAGNFATLASSRERRQLPSTPAAGKMPTTPATPVRAHSRKNSYSLHATHPFLPEMRPLSPISPPPEDYVSCVPPDASDRIIGTHVSLYTIRNSGAPPPDGLPRRRIKGAYRPHLETDKPDLGDFVVLKYSEATYWQGDRDAEDTRLQSGDEGETSSTDVERWSGGNVKGPKNRSRRRAKPKCKSSSMDIDRDVMPRSSPIPNNDVPKPNHDLSDKSTLKFNVKNNNSNSSSVGKGRNTGVSAGTGNMDLRVSSRLARKLSSLISQDKDSQLVDNGYEPRVGISASRQASRGGIPISPASGQLSTGRPQCMSTKCHIPAKEMSSVEIPVATASSPYPFISDTEISSDEDIIPATSAFGHGTATTLRAPTETSLVGQSREQRKQDRINAVKFTEGGPAGEGFRQGSTSIFSVVQLAIPGIGVMGPPAAKVSPAEYKLYIGRKGDQAPLFGSGGNTVIPGLGSGPLNDHIVVGGDSQYGGSSLFQPGGIVDVRRVEDPLLEATMEVKRLIYENGHQGGLVPAQGILGGLSVEKVYWSGVGCLPLDSLLPLPLNTDINPNSGTRGISHKATVWHRS